MTVDEILSCYKDNKRNWRELKEIYMQNKVIPFVGAGMSMPPYCSWAESLSNILDGKKSEQNELNELIAQMKYEEASDYVYKKVGRNNFYNKLKEEFSKNKIERVILSNATMILPDMFNGVVFTTNFDKTLEYAYDRCKKGFENVRNIKNMIENNATTIDALRLDSHNLYKIHGDIDDLDSLVFLKEEYEKAYNNDNFVQILENFVVNKTFLFLGSSLEGNDRYIKIFMDKINSYKAVVIKHYAFLPLPLKKKNQSEENYTDFMIDRVRQLGMWGIYPIWFPTGHYEAIEILLKSLSGEVLTKEIHIEGDMTQIPKHFNVFSSHHTVKQIFVDKCSEYFEYDNNLHISEKCLFNFNNVLETIKNNRLVFIEGGYGTGKTILAKRVQEELIEQQYHTLFLDSEWLINHNIEQFNFETYKKTNSELFIFIDAFDKLIRLRDNSFSLICDVDLKIATMLNLYKSCHIIINSRPFLKEKCENELSEVSEHVAYEIILQTDLTKMPCIKTKEFLTDEYNCFFKKIKNHNSKTILSSGLIKQWHKKAPISCKNPLFAYVIGTYFYEKQEKSEDCSIEILPENPLDIYGEFVKKTIEGRFNDTLKTYIDNNIQHKYFSIMKKVAVHMLHAKNQEINYCEDTSDVVFNNNDMYAISINSFGEKVRREIENFFDINQQLITSYVINNYFFNVFKDNDGVWMVRFSDINVLSCFAAIQYYDSFENIIREIDHNKIDQVIFKLKESLCFCELHPQTIDFLICKLKQLSKEKQSIILHNIRCILKKYKNNPVTEINAVKMHLVLCIVHIKLENNSYKNLQFEDFFKVFYRLCKTAKAINVNGIHKPDKHRYLVERYFMHCKFIDCDFKRLNYKFYNFSHSLLKDSNFLQCYFYDNRFDSCEISNVKFSLCMFNKKINFENVKLRRSVKFSNCIFQETEIKNPCLQGCNTILFEKCTLEKFGLIGIKSNTATIIFKNCVISKVKIKQCENIIVNMDNCIILEDEKIDVSNSRVMTRDSDKLNLCRNSHIII